ncbi:hypothetical protein D3C81_1071450 [compost metagenome]
MADPVGGHDRRGFAGRDGSSAGGLHRRAGNAVTTWPGRGNRHQWHCPGHSSGALHLRADRRSGGLARRVFRFLGIDADPRGGVLESVACGSDATQSIHLSDTHPLALHAVHDRTGVANQGPAGLADLRRFFRAMDIHGAAVERPTTVAFAHGHRPVWPGGRRRRPCGQKIRALGRPGFGATRHRHFAGDPDAVLAAHRLCTVVTDRAGLWSGLARLRCAGRTRHQPEPDFRGTARRP